MCIYYSQNFLIGDIYVIYGYIALIFCMLLSKE